MSRRGDNLGDAELVAAIIGGQSDCYGVLVDRHLGAVYSVVLRIVCNRSDAEDLTQDVFVRALQRLGQFGMEYSFRNWLLKIATNLAINHIRTRQRDRLRYPRIVERQQQTVEVNAEAAEGGVELPPAPDRLEASPITVGSEADRYRQDAGPTKVPQEWQPWLARLSDSERTAIVLFHFEDMSYLQVADALKVPLNTVRTLLHRGRRKLREFLTAAAPESGPCSVAI